MTQKGSAGGQITAVILRQKALDRYYENPQICENCGKLIPVPEGTKVSQTRQKRFCDKSCAAFFNNKKKPKQPKQVKQKASKHPFRINSVAFKSLEKVKITSPNWTVYRVTVAKEAKRIYKLSGLPRVCAYCGYDKFVDVCHVKPVSDFPDGTLIIDVNNINNLIPLCPNHHREFDNGLITVEEIKKLIDSREDKPGWASGPH